MVPLTQVREVQAGSQTRCSSLQGPLTPLLSGHLPRGGPFMLSQSSKGKVVLDEED